MEGGVHTGLVMELQYSTGQFNSFGSNLLQVVYNRFNMSACASDSWKPAFITAHRLPCNHFVQIPPHQSLTGASSPRLPARACPLEKLLLQDQMFICIFPLFVVGSWKPFYVAPERSAWTHVAQFCPISFPCFCSTFLGVPFKRPLNSIKVQNRYCVHKLF